LTACAVQPHNVSELILERTSKQMCDEKKYSLSLIKNNNALNLEIPN
jgi:hypothetical protein